jgi:hypothetical protein
MINMGNYAEISYSIHLILSLEAAKLSNNKRKTLPQAVRFIAERKTILL